MTTFCALGLGLALVVVSGCGDGEDEPKLVNEPCQVNEDCADNICHGQICASPTPKTTGDPCQGNGDCKSFNCAAAKCAAGTAAQDAECLADEECLSLNCDAGKCGLKKEGADCAADKDCVSNVCYEKKCAKACTKAADCTSKQDCGSDDGKRLFCYDRKYDKWIGRLCGIDGRCPITTKCLGYLGATDSFCSDECKTDMDCPSRFFCTENSKKEKWCQRRDFCSYCLHDDQCPEGSVCVSHNGEKFCTTKCTRDKDCPMYAECKSTKSGNVCLHQKGRCVGTGDPCHPCKLQEHCKSDSYCLTLSTSKEGMCVKEGCTTNSCSPGYTCQSSLKMCLPSVATKYLLPSCVKLNLRGQVGDIIEDFEMVAYKDTDGNNDLNGEKLQIVKLSDFKDKKIILVNIVGFW
jgi:hypothetical protein